MDYWIKSLPLDVPHRVMLETSLCKVATDTQNVLYILRKRRQKKIEKRKELSTFSDQLYVVKLSLNNGHTHFKKELDEKNTEN